MTAWDERVFWPEFKAAGMLVEASTVLEGCDQPTTFDVRYARPDVDPFTGARSNDHTIEYQHCDAPTLQEGDEVIIQHERGAILYRVRENPYVDPMGGASGYFRTAKLTRVQP